MRIGSAIISVALLAITAVCVVPSQAEPIKLPKSQVIEFKPILADPAQIQTSIDNLKKILIAVHMYSDDHGGNMPKNLFGENDKPILSWRVHLLPYIGEKELYSKFRLDEPWDSKHNKSLSETVVKVFQSPGLNEKEPVTYYKLFTGPGTAFSGTNGPRFATFTDGTSNTLAVVEAGQPVFWAKPDDIEVDVSIDSNKDLPEIKRPYKNAWHGTTWDGAVIRKVLKEKDVFDPDVLRAYITPNGGEVIGAKNLFKSNE